MSVNRSIIITWFSIGFNESCTEATAVNLHPWILNEMLEKYIRSRRWYKKKKVSVDKKNPEKCPVGVIMSNCSYCESDS